MINRTIIGTRAKGDACNKKSKVLLLIGEFGLEIWLTSGDNMKISRQEYYGIWSMWNSLEWNQMTTMSGIINQIYKSEFRLKNDYLSELGAL